MDRIRKLKADVVQSVRKNFRFATLSMIFILIFVNVFQWIFGLENSIVGVIFTILMSASMVRDLTAFPFRHLCIQASVLLLMAACACFVSNADPLLALPVNLIMIFIILYAFTYEYTSHLYFPYILSYLFLIFISPVTPEHLPKRLLGILVGAVGIIVYQLVNGRKRVAETARDVLLKMIDRAQSCMKQLLSGEVVAREPEQMRSDLCDLSKIINDRRRNALCISDAGFAMIDSGRGLENLVLLLYEMEGPVTPKRAALMRKISSALSACRSFMLGETVELPVFDPSDFLDEEDPWAESFYNCFLYVREHILGMTHPEKQGNYRKTMLSFSVRLKAALHLSPVRVVYALRVSCLLALCTLLVQLLALPHGKWLLFTVASVSLPYADDVFGKAKKRLLATLIGGICSVVLYSLIPSSTVRTAIMMLSGYLSFYFSEYTATYACSTIGALGGAVFMDGFGWGAVGNMLLIRLGYIAAGIVVAMLANCIVFPFRRNRATRQLWKKYVSTTELLTKVCRDPQTDPQLYYSLVIQAHLQEAKLTENSRDLGWDGAKDVLEKCRAAVRQAHRPQSAHHGPLRATTV